MCHLNSYAAKSCGSFLVFSFLADGSSEGTEGKSISDTTAVSTVGTSGRLSLIISANSKSTASSSSAVKVPAISSSIS